MYRSLRLFSLAGMLMILAGLVPLVSSLYFMLVRPTSRPLQSMHLGAILIIVGFQVLLIGLLADLVGFNRKILEEVLYRMRRLDLEEQKRHPGEAEMAEEEVVEGQPHGEVRADAVMLPRHLARPVCQWMQRHQTGCGPDPAQ